MALVTLASNVAASGNGAAQTWPGGQGLYTCEASNFNGATGVLQFKSDNGTWLDVGDDANISSNGAVRIFLPACEVRLRTITANPTGLYAYMDHFGL